MGLLPLALALVLVLASAPNCRNRQWGLRPSRRSVCAPSVLGAGVRLRVKCLGRCYVRAKSLK
jgi:hypothetical protein